VGQDGYLAIERHYALSDGDLDDATWRPASGSDGVHLALVPQRDGEGRIVGLLEESIPHVVADGAIAHRVCGDHPQSVPQAIHTGYGRGELERKLLGDDVLGLTIHRHDAVLAVQVDGAAVQVDLGFVLQRSAHLCTDCFWTRHRATPFDHSVQARQGTELAQSRGPGSPDSPFDVWVFPGTAEAVSSQCYLLAQRPCRQWIAATSPTTRR
jgi:hypothetical protein